MPREIWQTVSILGLVASVLSLTSLILQGFELGVSAPIQAMLHFYDDLLERLFGWATQPLSDLTTYIGRFIGVSFSLGPEWKHVFVLMWLYFGSDARSSFLQKRLITGTATLVVGAPVALAAAAASGGAESTSAANLVLAVGVPIAGFLTHAVIESLLTVAFYRRRGQSLGRALMYYFLTEVLSALLAAPVAIATALAAAPLGASRVALAALGVFIFVRASFWLLRGVYIGFTDRAEGESRLSRFLRSGSGQFGVLIFSVFLGALVFVALNAGLG